MEENTSRMNDKEMRVIDQDTIAGFSYAMMRSRAEMMNKLRQAAAKKPFDEIRDYIVSTHKGIQTEVLSRDDLEEIRKVFFDGRKTGRFLDIVRAILEAKGKGINYNDILKYMQDCKEMEYMGTYTKFAVLATEYFGPSMQTETLTAWINECVENEDFESASHIFGSVVGNRGVPGDARNVLDWIKVFTPNDKGREAHWEFYANAALAIIEGGTRTAGAEFALQCPGIKDAFTETDVTDWITNLKKAGRNDLAAKIEIMAFSKGYSGTNLSEIKQTEKIAHSLMGYEIGLGSLDKMELHAYMIEHLPDGSVSLEDVIEWINEETRFNKSTTVHKIAIAAINKGIATKDNVDQWVLAWYENDDFEGSCEIAIAAVNKKGGIAGLTVKDIEAWTTMGKAEYGQEILLAALRSDYAGTISPETYKNVSARCHKSDRDGLIYQLMSAELATGNESALEQARLGMGADGFKGVFDELFKDGLIEQAAALMNSASITGKLFDFQAADVQRWAHQCIKAGKPAMAVSIGLSARDAGIAVSNEDISAWYSSCLDGKTPEDSVKNAAALIAMYRARPEYIVSTTVPDEIDRSYQKLMSDKSANGAAQNITVTTPYREAVRKIDAILFGVD